MPELPEVETIARQLRDRGVEGKILAVRTDWPRMVEPLTPAAFTRRFVELKLKPFPAPVNGFKSNSVPDSTGWCIFGWQAVFPNAGVNLIAEKFS